LLHFVWWRSLTYAPSGDLSDFTDGQIARWADWDGDPGHLVSALKTAGFLDAQRTLHDWDDYAGRWIERRRADADRKRQSRAGQNGVQGMSGGRPAGRRPESGVPDLTGPDLNRTGPDHTPTPKPPPPQAGEGAGTKTRGRRGRRGEDRLDTQSGDAAAAPPEVLVTPLTPEDRGLWDRALAELRPILSDYNHAQLSRVEPIGRAPDGGLRLRSPPGDDLAHRLRSHVARALLDAGDERAGNVAIVGS
jgi:hypothetical protein